MAIIWILNIFICIVFVSGRRTRNLESNGIPSSPEDVDALMPRFAERILNVTVTVGRDALLACVVDNLRGFKVAWVRVDTQTILSIHHNVITQNPRISLTYNDHRSWYLHIKNVVESDRGWYMCQVNTDPMRSRQGYLQVVVPPSIIDKETSTDMVVRESTNVTLVCKATGYPEPYVMWRREDGEDFNYNGETECGRPVHLHGKLGPSILKGEETIHGAYPWHAGIYFVEPKIEYKCGGTLISEKVVISAAHCFSTDNKIYRNVTLKDFSKIRVTFGKWYRNIDHPRDTTSAQIREIVGWGRTNEHDLSQKLMKTRMPFVSFEECQLNIEETLFTYVQPDKFCAGDKNSLNVVDGETLHITRVSRIHMGAYLCIASNGVPPSVSKRVSLRVQFPPMLSIPNQLEGAYIGQDIALECHTEAYPTSINYWTTEKGDMIVAGDKYETVFSDNGYNKYMMLKIRGVSRSDFVSYKCVAKNSLGETDGLIKLDEIPAPSTTSTSSTTPTSILKKKGKGKNWKERGQSENQVLGDFGVEEWKDTKMGDEDFTLPSQKPPNGRGAGLNSGYFTLLLPLFFLLCR